MSSETTTDVKFPSEPTADASPSRHSPLAAHDSDSWDLIIRPKRHLLDVNLKELWDYRDLLVMFVKRDIVTVYKQTILGPIWFFVQPIMTMAVYVVVFGNIAKISTDDLPAPLFYLAGIVMWNYFAESSTRRRPRLPTTRRSSAKSTFPG